MITKGYQSKLSPTKIRQEEKNLERSHHKKNLSDIHGEILKNILSSNIGKPTNVEAQRILKVLDELEKNIIILNFIDNDLLIQFTELNQVSNASSSIGLNLSSIRNISEKTMNLISTQAYLEKQYIELSKVEEEEEQKQEVQETESEEQEEEELDPEEIERIEREKREREEKRQRDFARTCTKISHNLRDLLRSIRMNENDFIIIKSLRNPNNTEMLDMVQCIKSLRIIMLKKLSIAAEENDSYAKQLQDLKEKISNLEKTKHLSEMDLEKLKNERQRHANQKKDEIDKLKKQIEDIKNTKKQQKKKLEKETKQNLDLLEKEHKTKKEKLENDLKQKQVTLKQTIDKNAKEEAELKRKKQTNDQFLSESVSMYDQLMEQWDKEKKELTTEYMEIQQELNDLEKHFQDVAVERERELKLEKEWKKRRDDFDLEEKKKSEAIRHLQVNWDAFKPIRLKKKKGRMGKMGKMGK